MGIANNEQVVLAAWSQAPNELPSRRIQVLGFINDDGSEVPTPSVLIQKRRGRPVAVRRFQNAALRQLDAVLLEYRPNPRPRRAVQAYAPTDAGDVQVRLAGIDAFLAAVLKDRVEEALGLAGAGARGHDGGLLLRKPTERVALMPMGRMAKGNFRKRFAVFRRTLEGQVDGQVWPFGQVLSIRQKVIDNAGQRRVGRTEAGGEKILERAGDLGGDGGWNHWGSIVGLPLWGSRAAPRIADESRLSRRQFTEQCAGSSGQRLVALNQCRRIVG